MKHWDLQAIDYAAQRCGVTRKDSRRIQRRLVTLSLVTLC